MAKKKTADKGVPEVVAKCDSLCDVAYGQSDIERNFRLQLTKDEMEILKTQIVTSMVMCSTM